jgi:hypothetical protein
MLFGGKEEEKGGIADSASLVVAVYISTGHPGGSPSSIFDLFKRLKV